MSYIATVWHELSGILATRRNVDQSRRCVVYVQAKDREEGKEDLLKL